MTPEQLKIRVATTERLSASTLGIWCYALNYIFENGWADITDRTFIEGGKNQFKVSSQTITRHLARMVKAGLLRRFRLVEHPEFPALADNKSPRTLYRYTMPGMNAQFFDTRMESFVWRRGHDSTAAENRKWKERFDDLAKRSNRARQRTDP